MKIFLLAGTAALLLQPAVNAQVTPTSPPAAPGARPAVPAVQPGAAVAKPVAPAKPRIYVATDKRAYLVVAEALQFQLKMSLRVRNKHKGGNPEMLSLANKIYKEAIDLWTPGVDMAMAHGLDGRAIPQDLTKSNSDMVTKIMQANKDIKKWNQAFFEHYAKEGKRTTVAAESVVKTVQDPDLKVWIEKAVALLNTQTASIEAKLAELKGK